MEPENLIQLELKYCERCGGLWIRPLESENVYCATCAIAMMEVASSTKRKSSPRLPINRDNSDHDRHGLILLNKRGGNA